VERRDLGERRRCAWAVAVRDGRGDRVPPIRARPAPHGRGRHGLRALSRRRARGEWDSTRRADARPAAARRVVAAGRVPAGARVALAPARARARGGLATTTRPRAVSGRSDERAAVVARARARAWARKGDRRRGRLRGSRPRSPSRTSRSACRPPRRRMTPALDVVVVSYRTPELLRQCLRSLQRRTVANQCLIVVDNASGDGSADLVTAEFPAADLVEAPGNLGFAAAANAGIARGSAPYVLVLNPDTEVPPETVDALL